MTRLIDADALKKENERLLHCDFPYLSEMTLEELIDEAPTINAEPQWIPCSERLPEEMGEYMTCDERGNIHIFFHSPDFRFPFCIRPDNPRYYEPIAWMPLPKPYSKTAGKEH